MMLANFPFLVGYVIVFLGEDLFISKALSLHIPWYLDVLLEVRINGLDQWVVSPTYKWGILGL